MIDQGEGARLGNQFLLARPCLFRLFVSSRTLAVVGCSLCSRTQWTGSRLFQHLPARFDPEAFSPLCVSLCVLLLSARLNRIITFLPVDNPFPNFPTRFRTCQSPSYNDFESHGIEFLQDKITFGGRFNFNALILATKMTPLQVCTQI